MPSKEALSAELGPDTVEVESVTVNLACPVPSCSYVPPAAMSEAGQIKALERHISLSHSLADLPAVTDSMREAMNPSVTVEEVVISEPEPEPESAPEPAPEPAKPREAVGVQQRAARTQGGSQGAKGVASITPIGETDPKKALIADRAEKWGKYLFDDFNPMLVSTASTFAGIPEPWLDGGPGQDGSPLRIPTPEGKVLTFWDPSLREQLSLSEKDCNRIAKAGATFSVSPMGQVLSAFLENNAHYIALAGALAAAGSYGWRLMRIKGEVTQLKELVEQQMAMQQPQTAQNPAA